MPPKKVKQKNKAVKPEIKENEVKQATKSAVLQSNVEIALDTKETPTNSDVVDDTFVIDETLFTMDVVDDGDSTPKEKKDKGKTITPLMPTDKVISAMLGEYEAKYEIETMKGNGRKLAIQNASLSINDVYGLLPIIVPDDATPKGSKSPEQDDLKGNNPLDWKATAVNKAFVRTRMKQLNVQGLVFAIRKGKGTNNVDYVPSIGLYPDLNLYLGSFLHYYQIKSELFDSSQWSSKFRKILKDTQTKTKLFPCSSMDLDYFLSLPLATVKSLYVDFKWNVDETKVVMSDFKVKLKSERFITLHGSIDNAMKQVIDLLKTLTKQGKDTTFFDSILENLKAKKVEETST